MKTNSNGSLISLDTKSPISWSEQIRIGLMRQIATGGLKAGERVPSIRALSRDLKVTQALVRKAFDQLVDEGWLEVRSGLGTYVSDNALSNLNKKSNAPAKDEFLIREEDMDSFGSSFGIPGTVASSNELPPEFVPSMDAGGFLPAHDDAPRKLTASSESAVYTPGVVRGQIEYDADEEVEEEERAYNDLSASVGIPVANPGEEEPVITADSIKALLAQVPVDEEVWTGVGTGEFLALVHNEEDSLYLKPEPAAPEESYDDTFAKAELAAQAARMQELAYYEANPINAPVNPPVALPPGEVVQPQRAASPSQEAPEASADAASVASNAESTVPAMAQTTAAPSDGELSTASPLSSPSLVSPPEPPSSLPLSELSQSSARAGANLAEPPRPEPAPLENAPPPHRQTGHESASGAALSRWSKPSAGRNLPNENEEVYGQRSDTIDISGSFGARPNPPAAKETVTSASEFVVQSEEALFIFGSSDTSSTNLEAVMTELTVSEPSSAPGFDQLAASADRQGQALKAGPEFYDESGMFAPDAPLTASRFLNMEQQNFDANVEGSIWATNLADVFGNATVYGVASGGRDLEVSSVTALVEARWQASLRDWIDDCSINEVHLSEPAGIGELREQIANWLRSTRGMTCSAQHVVITNGAQEGRDLAARLLIDRGRRVAFEEPGSVLNRLFLEAHGAEVMSVNVDESGIIIDELEALEDVTLLYTMPSAHFPTGAVLSRNRRLRVLDWAVNANAIVIEDDINCEYFYDSRVISSIHAFDTENRTIYIGSLSHIIPPSWRLGFMVVPPAVRPAVLRLKSLTNRCTSPIVQRLVLKLFESGFMQEQARKLQRLCEQRRQLILQELQTWPQDLISYSPVKGGLTQTIWLPPHVNDIQLYRKCQAMGFSVIPASPCFQTYPTRPGLVLNFGATPSEQMLLGLAKLKALLMAL